MSVNVYTVTAAALVTALATGLGAVPFAFVRGASVRWLGVANAIAAGFMLGASAGLVYEGGRVGGLRTAAGFVAGVALIVPTLRYLATRDDLHAGALRGADARKAITIVGVMFIHSMTEGVGVGVSYGGGDRLGLLITVAIAIHNIPEGLAISLVLIPRGASVAAATWWSVFSSIPQPLLAAPAFLFVEQVRGTLPVGLGFAAGAMTALAAIELVPEAREAIRDRAVALTLGGSLVAMALLQVLLLR